jgi:hypothetical protein
VCRSREKFLVEGSNGFVYVIFFFEGALGGGSVRPYFSTAGNWFPGMAGLAKGIAAAGQAIVQGGVPSVRLSH